MASFITAGNATNGLQVSSDNTGILELKSGTGSGTTAVTIGTGQQVAMTLGSAAAPSITFSGDTNTGIFSPAADTIAFAEGGVESARIDSSGNLLVGTTTLVGKLNVLASSNVGAGYNAYFRNTWSGDVGYPALYIAKFDNNTTTSQLFIRFSVNNEATASGQINANGANSAAFGTFSDKRLKTNIQDLPSQLANIMALRPVEYDYIESEGGGHQIGFVAQEVQEIYPDLVGDRGDGMLTLTDMNKNDARLIKAIQEQQHMIETLQAKVAALEGA